MLIKVGYEIVFSCPEPMAMVLMLYLHLSRALMTTTFGANLLQSFKVWTDEVPEDSWRLFSRSMAGGVQR